MTEPSITPEVAAKPVKQSVAGVDKLKEDRSLMVKAANSYMATGLADDFGKWSLTDKLTAFARTPKKYIKQRRIGTINVPYIEHQIAEKVLGFVFNFQISNEVLESKITEESINGKKSYLAYCVVKFTFWDDRTQREIVRTVCSSHRAYANPATTPADSLKSAISKSYTVVAKTFGLFSDIKEEQAYDVIENATVTGEIKQPPAKDFDF